MVRKNKLKRANSQLKEFLNSKLKVLEYFYECLF